MYAFHLLLEWVSDRIRVRMNLFDHIGLVLHDVSDLVADLIESTQPLRSNF